MNMNPLSRLEMESSPEICWNSATLRRHLDSISGTPGATSSISTRTKRHHYGTKRYNCGIKRGLNGIKRCISGTLRIRNAALTEHFSKLERYKGAKGLKTPKKVAIRRDRSTTI